MRDDLLRDVRNHERRIIDLEGVRREGMEAIMRHVDSLFAVVDQKFDRYREDNLQIWSRLGSLLAVAEGAPSRAPRPPRRPSSRRPIASASISSSRSASAASRRRSPAASPSICRTSSAAARCWTWAVAAASCWRCSASAASPRAASTRATRWSAAAASRVSRPSAADLLEALERAPEASLGGVVSLHVIEHLPAAALPRLAALAWRALRPGGVLILETPNPMSLVVGARNFWLDPTHQRPVHPLMLSFCLEQAGFDPIERLDLRAFDDGQRLPELAPAELAADLRPLAEQVNRLRDRLDDLLFGFQDYALVATKPSRPMSPLGPGRFALVRGLPGFADDLPVGDVLGHVLARLGEVEGPLLVPGQRHDPGPARLVLAGRARCR